MQVQTRDVCKNGSFKTWCKLLWTEPGSRTLPDVVRLDRYGDFYMDGRLVGPKGGKPGVKLQIQALVHGIIKDDDEGRFSVAEFLAAEGERQGIVCWPSVTSREESTRALVEGLRRWRYLKQFSVEVEERAIDEVEGDDDIIIIRNIKPVAHIEIASLSAEEVREDESGRTASTSPPNKTRVREAESGGSASGSSPSRTRLREEGSCGSASGSTRNRTGKLRSWTGERRGGKVRKVADSDDVSSKENANVSQSPELDEISESDEAIRNSHVPRLTKTAAPFASNRRYQSESSDSQVLKSGNPCYPTVHDVDHIGVGDGHFWQDQSPDPILRHPSLSLNPIHREQQSPDKRLPWSDPHDTPLPKDQGRARQGMHHALPVSRPGPHFRAILSDADPRGVGRRRVDPQEYTRNQREASPSVRLYHRGDPLVSGKANLGGWLANKLY